MALILGPAALFFFRYGSLSSTLYKHPSAAPDFLLGLFFFCLFLGAGMCSSAFNYSRLDTVILIRSFSLFCMVVWFVSGLAVWLGPA